jgi:restriction system protein
LAQQAKEQAERERLAQKAREQAEQEEAEQEQKELEQLERLKTLDGILRLTPTEFEHFVCKLLSTYEYLHDVKRVGGSGDLAVDLAARDRDGNLIIIQCKRYMPGNKVGSNEIQKFIGMMYVHHQASKGIFITTSTYTQPALALAEKHDIFLINGERLVDIVKNRLAR